MPLVVKGVFANTSTEPSVRSSVTFALGLLDGSKTETRVRFTSARLTGLIPFRLSLVNTLASACPPMTPSTSLPVSLTALIGCGWVTTVALLELAGSSTTGSPWVSTALPTTAVLVAGLQAPCTVKVVLTVVELFAANGPRLLHRIEPPLPVTDGVDDLNSMQ